MDAANLDQKLQRRDRKVSVSTDTHDLPRCSVGVDTADLSSSIGFCWCGKNVVPTDPGRESFGLLEAKLEVRDNVDCESACPVIAETTALPSGPSLLAAAAAAAASAALKTCSDLKVARPLDRKRQIMTANSSGNKENATTKNSAKCELPQESSETENLGVVSTKHSQSERLLFHCDVCQASFTRKHSLTVHLRRHMEETCKQESGDEDGECASEGALDEEPGLVDPNDQEQEQRQQHDCPLCRRSYRSRAALYNHLRAEHAESQVSRHLEQLAPSLMLCSACGKAFRSVSALQAHEPVHSGARNHMCPTCGKGFPSRASVRAHTATHSGLKPFHCALCGTVFAKKDSLRTHLRKHSGERPFSCDICGAAFDRRFTLKNHRLVHTGERPHVCAACGKAFATRGALATHERLHHQASGRLARPVPQRRPRDFQLAVCDQCGKVYSNAANLRIHKRTHSGLRPFSCTVCGAAFAKKYTLQCHMRRHTDERPYACDICGAAFFRQSTLATHHMRHTGERPHQCVLCGRRFIQSASLAYHLKHHDTAVPEKPLDNVKNSA